jgi:apolipoprotein N-acyltransferase
MFSHPTRLLLVAGSGIASGLAFGAVHGWIVVQAALVLLGLQLLSAVDSPSRASQHLAAFVVALYGASQWGTAASISPSYWPWNFCVIAFVSCAQGAVAGVTGWLAFRLALPTAVRLVVVVPALWTIREWLGTFADVVVPWLALGYVQAPDGPFVAALPLGGVLLAGWCSVTASIALAIALRIALQPRRMSTKARIAIASVVPGGAVLATFATATWTAPSGHVVAELIQGGAVPEGNFSGPDAARRLAFYADAVATSNARLMITPQLALRKTPDALPPGYLAAIDARLKARDADLLIGLHLASGRPNGYYNAAIALGDGGAQRYLKHRLFPYGEYLPFGGEANAWLNDRRALLHADAARGPLAADPLFAGGLRLAMAVCYEIGFGDALRAQAAAADALVVMAGDATHDSLQFARQVRQVAQARALEFQKPLMRTSDVRGTYFIDAQGRVTSELPPGEPGIVQARVQGRTGLTPYARVGDLLALSIAGMALACGLLVAWARCKGFGHRAADGGPARAPAMPAAQRGQVLPVALALLVVIAGFFYLMVNAGQTVTEKLRVTNAADAAAYSAAVVEARALNYDAYLNRAMVANQMAIAQMVSFASWIDYFATAADNFGAYATQMNFFILPNPKVAVLDVAFGGSAAVAAYFSGSTVHDYADYVIDYGIPAIIALSDAATQLLATNQQLVQANLTAGVRQQQIARQVVQTMDPTLDAEVVLVSHGFDAFTKNYSGDDRDRFADVAMRSRDDFTRERNYTVSGSNIPLIRKNGALKKRGGTDLVGLDEWRAVDTLELHGQSFGCGKMGLSWCGDIQTPIGWGGIEFDAGDGDAGRGYHGNAYRENGTTASRADSVMRMPDYGHYSGLPTSQEIADVEPAADQTTGITILVTKAQSDTLTSGNAATVKPGGSLGVFGDHPAGGKVISLSRAQVFFDRISARADGKAEIASVYNPYWRVKLVAPTGADRAYAASRQGGLSIPDFPAP